jgi:predicted RNase H-like nuclease
MMQRTDVYIGFDSAWTDNVKAPGAICSVHVEKGRAIRFDDPQLVCFDEALAFIRSIRSEHDNTLIALDQPTIVPNIEGMRATEHVAPPW